VLAAAVGAGTASAAEPIPLGGWRLTLGGEASGSWAPEDLGFFNDTGYERNPMRLFRLRLTAELRAGARVAVLTDLRSEDMAAPRAYALYLRVRPWPSQGFDVQAGLVPPIFGAHLRRTYGRDNLLIGEPLAYQYLTTLRADALPAEPDELLVQRGLGWRTHYGSAVPAPGVPLVSGERWDAGLQAHWRGHKVEAAAAVTQGTLSRPRVREDNGGKQLMGRVGYRPSAAVALGVSAARGDYASDRATGGALVPRWCCRQQTWGADAEYSAGHGLLRAEAVWASWEVSAWTRPLRARAVSLEGRYTILPGLYAAARACHVGFSTLTGSSGTLSWDAPARRLEAGLGYSLRRNVVVKAVFQHNAREGGRVLGHDLGAAEVLWWF
jgi:hypothetical protein